MSLLPRLQRILRESPAILDKPTRTPQEIADKHGVPLADIEAQLKKGIAVEKEHTSDEAIAREIALDHLSEMPDYYDKLAKVEEDAPAMAAGHGAIAGIGVGPKGEPGVMLPRKKRVDEAVADTFGNADVFDVSMDLVMNVRDPKKNWERYSKYVGIDEVGEDIRAHARKHWKRDIILRDSKTGVMRFLRRRQPRVVK